MYSFQLVAWLEVDPNQPAINKAELAKAAFPVEGRNFTAVYGVNGRVFSCILDEKNHLLTVEIKNEDGQRITPGRLESIFTRLLSPEVLGHKAEEVEITVLPTDDAIEYVLGFVRLDKVDILVKRPNNDDITAETNRVMKRLIEMKAKSERSILTRQAKTDGLELDEEHMRLARVAAQNGHVDSAGVDADGEHGKRSTREVPKIVRRVLSEGSSYLAALRDVAKSMRDGREKL
jgi:hypothetical protein